VPLRKLLLFQRPDGTPVQFWQYEQSSELAKIVDPERRQQRIDSGVLPFETVEVEARAASTVHFTTLREQAEAAVAAWRSLGQALDNRAGPDAPPTSRVQELLDQIAAVAGRFAVPDGEAAVAPPPQAAGDAAAPVAVDVAGGLASREEALRSLATIAEFFRRTEPMSPLAYTLQEALRRARMSWPELLEEIVPDSGLRGQILSSLGIRPPPTE
jgi:type VI secretion system protein ImpA